MKDNRFCVNMYPHASDNLANADSNLYHARD